MCVSQLRVLDFQLNVLAKLRNAEVKLYESDDRVSKWVINLKT